MGEDLLPRVTRAVTEDLKVVDEVAAWCVGLVVPAIGATIARSSLSNKLKSVDFPAFVLPAIAILYPSLIILPAL